MLIPESFLTSDRPAVFDSKTARWWSYQELTAEVQALAERLKCSRRLAFCFCRNDAPTVINYLGCLAAGHPVALLDAAMGVEAKEGLLEAYRPELLLLSAEDVWIPATYAASVFRGSCICEGAPYSGPPLHRGLAAMLSTSGTTGSPRFVRLTARNLLSNADSIIAALGLTDGDRAIASLPFHYSYGLSVLNTHLRAGASVVTLTEGLVSARFWAAVRKHTCSSFAGVPYSYQVLDRLNLAELDVPSLRTLTQAGGKLHPELIARFHELMARRGGRFFVMYGQTEATARIAILPAEDLPRKLGSAGRPIPGGSFQIRIGEGIYTTEPGVEGELIYSGPNVMMGYGTCRADLALGDILQGSLETGDLCRLDDDGYLFVIARMKRDAKIFGLRINLDEVEGLLKVHGPTAVVSGPDKLVVFCEYGDAEFLAGLQHQLSVRLNVNYRAIELHRIEHLPVHPSGKTDYSVLRGWASDARGVDGGPTVLATTAEEGSGSAAFPQ